jgi:RNA polymerase sigma factor (sigma-70 family)
MGNHPERRVRDLLTPQQKQDLEYAYGRALAVARRFGLSQPDAEDVVGVATLRAIERIGQYQPRLGIPFLAWFRRLLARCVMDEFRSHKRAKALLTSSDDALLPVAQLDPDERIANAEAAARRAAIVSALTPELREVFDRWIDQHEGRIDGKRAAELLGCTLPQYEAKKHRVRRRIEKTMERLRLSPRDLWSRATSTTGERAVGDYEKERT